MDNISTFNRNIEISNRENGLEVAPSTQSGTIEQALITAQFGVDNSHITNARMEKNSKVGKIDDSFFTVTHGDITCGLKEDIPGPIRFFGCVNGVDKETYKTSEEFLDKLELLGVFNNQYSYHYDSYEKEFSHVVGGTFPINKTKILGGLVTVGDYVEVTVPKWEKNGIDNAIDKHKGKIPFMLKKHSIDNMRQSIRHNLAEMNTRYKKIKNPSKKESSITKIIGEMENSTDTFDAQVELFNQFLEIYVKKKSLVLGRVLKVADEHIVVHVGTKPN